MGTSQSINSSVKGNPNWGKLGNSLSRVSSVVNISNKQSSNILRHFVNAIGGSQTAGTGRSSSFGNAGVRTANRLLSFINGVQALGLSSSLSEIGIYDLKDLSVSDLINNLILHCTDGSANLDEAAAKSANDKLLQQLFDDVDDINDAEQQINSIDNEKKNELLVIFFSHYIVEFSSELFGERILNKENGNRERTFFQILNYIKNLLKEEVKNRDLSTIRWENDDGTKLIKEIQTEILKVWE